MMISVRPALVLSALLLALPSCEDGQGLSGQGAATEGAGLVTAPQARSEVRDVERPDIFKVSELALWDGRPSLGGVWAAHPDVKEPERAILRNQTTGQTVAAALFRRERNNPGPRIQLSSDAAAALGILAGQPTEVSVVVVRQEEIKIEPAPAPTEAAETEPGETAAPETGTSAAEAGAVAATAAAAPEAQPKKPNFLQRMFSRKKPAGEVADGADAAAMAATAESATPPEVETATLDPVTSTAAAAIAEAEANDKPAARPAAPAARAARAEPAAPTAPAAPAGLKNPFVQVGLFSVEENATAAATSLRQAGIVPSVQETTVNGKTFWRVVVGPISTTADQAAVMAQVKKLGYEDAFLAPK